MSPLNARIQLFDAVTGEHVGYFWALQPGTWCKADKPNQAMVVEIPDGSENLSLKILKADLGLGEMFLVPAYAGPTHPLMSFVLDGRTASGQSVAQTMGGEEFFGPPQFDLWTVEESAEGAIKELKAKAALGVQRFDLSFCLVEDSAPTNSAGTGGVTSADGIVIGLPSHYFQPGQPGSTVGRRVRLLVDPAGDPPFVVDTPSS